MQAGGYLQKCYGLPAGIEAAVHAMQHIYEEDTTEAILLVDACSDVTKSTEHHTQTVATTAMQLTSIVGENLCQIYSPENVFVENYLNCRHISALPYLLLRCKVVVIRCIPCQGGVWHFNLITITTSAPVHDALNDGQSIPKNNRNNTCFSQCV